MEISEGMVAMSIECSPESNQKTQDDTVQQQSHNVKTKDYMEQIDLLRNKLELAERKVKQLEEENESLVTQMELLVIKIAMQIEKL